MPENRAAWLPAKRADLEVKAAPYTAPREGEIVVRNHAVAINPIDWIVQSVGGVIFPWMRYPAILGSDVAGEVAEIGPGVTRFRIGDRVLGHALSASKDRNSPAEGAFQTYTVLLAHMASPFPETLAAERAVVLPLGLSTAACALFEKEHLGLQSPASTPRPTGKTLLIWGGSTSVGSNAIQLAVAAGYEVVTTASPKNFSYVKGLGASEAFDYKSGTVVQDIARALAGKTVAGALAIGAGSPQACVAVLHQCQGDKVVAMATPASTLEGVPRKTGRLARLVPILVRFLIANMALTSQAKRAGVRTSFLNGSSIMSTDVGPAIYADFLPSALAEGRYAAVPEPWVVGEGLEAIASALEAQMKGVSARKIVVRLHPAGADPG